jgi:hypothetical protein
VSYATLTPVTTFAIDFQDHGASAGADGFYLTNVEGIWMAPIRAPVDDRSLADGGVVHTFYYGARHLTLEGFILPQALSDGDWNTISGLRDTLMGCLDDIVKQDGSYVWTPPGSSAHTLTVRCDVPATFATNGLLSTFIFGLVAANPHIVVA